MKIKWPWSKPVSQDKAAPADLQKGWAMTMEGPLNTSWDLGWWQQNLQAPGNLGLNGTVEACVSALAQTSAMCPIEQLKDIKAGGKERQTGANAERVMLNPNSYETRSLFITNLIRSVYFSGNGYAVAQRDDRGAISSLHLLEPRSTRGVVSAESGEVFYYATPRNNQPGIRFDDAESRIFPARDVLNLRLYTSRDPLIGDTPIQAAANSVAANSAITGHQARFFNNMSRASGILSTDETLTAEQMTQLRQAMDEQSKGINSGKMPILSRGLKFQPLSLSSQDAQLVEALGMSIADISRVFRVPLSVINDMTGSTFNNSENLMNWFLASGLGFLLEHIELELTRLFQLPFGTKLNFNTSVLLRSDLKGKIEAIGEGVMKGIFSPNEARHMVELGSVEGGDEPRVQQQVVPLTWADEQPDPAPAPAAPEPDEIEAALLQGMAKTYAAG